MSNFPRFGRARNRPSLMARPVSAAGQPPAAEPKPEILPFSPATQTDLQLDLDTNSVGPSAASPPIISPRPHQVSSPVKKAASPSASPKFEDFVTRVPSPPPVKITRSPPVSPPNQYSDRRNGQTNPPHSSEKSRRTSPPVSPLALPRTQVTAVNGTATQPRIQPEVEQKKIVYNKTVEKPVKSDRSSEYGSGKPPQKQQAEVINLTGHNVGAVMEINQSSSAGSHRLGGETTKKNETEGGGGVHSGNHDKKTEEKKKWAMTPFMNSNFQSVNNSVLYDSSCSHRDPGLHLAFPDMSGGGEGTVEGRKNYKP